MNLFEALNRMNESAAAPIDPEAAVMRLRERAVCYAEAAKGPRFNPGDWITPFPDSNIARAGEPFLVIETRRIANLNFVANPCSCSRADIRVLRIADGDIGASWLENADFQSWPVAKAETPAPVHTEAASCEA